MNLSLEHFIRLVRILITCYIMFFITWYFQMPDRIWCLMTIWFVMLDYETIGGVIKKGLFRLMGTSISAVYGLMVIYFCKNNVVIDMLAFIPLLFWYAHRFFSSDKMYILTIGVVTLTIILFNNNDISSGFIRFFNILIGNIAAIIMSFIFYPNYASKKLTTQLSSILETNIAFFDPPYSSTFQFNDFFSLEKNIQQQLKVLYNLIDDAEYENIINDKLPIFRTLYQINTQMVYIFYSLWLYKSEHLLNEQEWLEIRERLTILKSRLTSPSHLVEPSSFPTTSKHVNLIQLIKLIHEYEHGLHQVIQDPNSLKMAQVQNRKST